MPDHQHATSDASLIEKTGHERYLRAGRSGRSRMKIMGLAIALAVSLLVLLVVSIYSVSTISSLSNENISVERQLILAHEKIERLNPLLVQARNELNDLVQNRFPNLQEMRINSMMEIDEGLIKQIVFTKIKQGNREIYKYLVVAENSTVKKINPSFRVLLFDEFGVHVGSADVIDKHALESGESRDYTDEFELFFESLPKHFYIEDLSAQYNTSLR